jgi:hypothetical protein
MIRDRIDRYALAILGWTPNGPIEVTHSGTRLGYQSDRSQTVPRSVGKKLYCFAIWFVLLEFKEHDVPVAQVPVSRQSG